MRADQWLVEHGLAASRSQAQRLIAAGARWQAPTGWKPLAKSDELPPDARVELIDAAEARYVSRGGLKLEGVLRASRVEVRGWRCLDVGQSTGGFTNCLLHNEAASVLGVDVGRGQLHPRLRADPRVLALEGINARSMTTELLQNGLLGVGADLHRFGPPFDLIVGDLSFISLTLVLPALAPLLKPGGQALLLVKPQFELQPGQIGKGGIVRDVGLYADVQRRMDVAVQGQGWQMKGWFDSPITGGDGNREFFVHAERARDIES